MSLLEYAEMAVKFCEKLGVDEAEAFAQNAQTKEIVLERAEIQNERAKTHCGIGIRVIEGKRLGFAFASALSKESIEQACRDACKLAKASLPNPDWVSLPSRARLPRTPEGVFDEETAEMSVNDVLKLTLKAYDAAKKVDQRVSIDDGRFSVLRGEVAVSNTRGVEAAEKSTLVEGYLVCVAKSGTEVSSMTFEYDIATALKDFSAEKIGRLAAEKAVASLKPKAVPSFTGQVILDCDPAATVLLQPVINSVNADNVQRGRSLWGGKVGQKVASEKLTLVDDGLLPKGIGSSSFDVEGVPRQKTRLVTAGKLEGFLHNSFTANKEKKKSTGNASRGGYNMLPTVFVSNLIVKAGKKKIEDIIRKVDKGIYVRRFSGNVRPDSGEFSGIAKQASYIEKGEVKHPLKETMISGNAFTALNSIIEVGAEARPTMLQAYVPPILVDNINIVSK
ncbi:MAG: TldD/PmbA family protein [Candidatus Bathyarchaeia archaeon]